MGLFSDLFSTKPAEEAAAAKKAGLQQGYDALSGAYGQGRGALTGAINQGQGALTGAFGQGRDALTSSFEQGRGALTGTFGQGIDALSGLYGQGRDALNSGYSDASALYKPLLASTGAGASAYGDAVGANGAAGISRGGSAFKSLPGYSGGLTTGIDAVDRGAAARGALGGGNTSADIIKFASDYDANKYGNYVSSLSPYLGLNASATAGAAGLDAARGGALNSSFAGEGAAKAGLFQGQGGALNSSFQSQGSGLNANFGALGSGLNADFGALGTGLNSSYQGQGGAASANFTGQGSAEADAKLAPYGASQNFWGALMGGAGLALKASGIGGFAPGAGAGGGNIVLGGPGGPGQFRT